jgi:hypothetical protein
MFISVRNRDLRHQVCNTSCWISTAHFLLEYLGVNESLASLHARYYNRDANSASLMSGAGRPKTILQEYAQSTGRFPKTLTLETAGKATVVAVIADSIGEGIPVIAALRSQQISGFVHAVVITAVEPRTGSVGFKDPGTGTSPRPFGVDVRVVQYQELEHGFYYGRSPEMKKNVFAYCTRIIYMRPLSERGPSD